MKTLSLIVALAACAQTGTRTSSRDTDPAPAIHAMYERNGAGCRRDAGSEDQRACMLDAARGRHEVKREALQQQRSRTQLGKPVAAAHQEP
ncbi:hypothetical protein QTI66_36190 [Variovorax sp. J22R133]|uniref:hypothetical protein n=1 Tax=Variovorax brevis TaxID=3053503 RepID=UPI0025749B43|nr:hypothetical protein [Variovorax sp. J22R133]MDM0117555.1 hypothetical protein [Variovorax sp. J22R133]